MARRPVVLIHGYSDRGESFQPWADALVASGYDARTLHACSYRTLTNEVTIKDIAEGFDRALRIRAGLDDGQSFDAIVHSTGMLVIRAWLTNFPERRDRLQHLVGLAPASFGSPLAHKGRSWLGSIFKGSRELGPDFLEAGDRVLDGLELASRFTWDLAHLDLLGTEAFYGPTRTTPFVFIFCGTKSYGGLRSLVNEPGADGAVRWAGCPLNTRKIILNLARELPAGEQFAIAPWTHIDIPLLPAAGLNHTTILSKPTTELIDLVISALQVSSEATFETWRAHAGRATRAALADLGEWQQFIVRAVDERGDPIPDYNIRLFGKSGRDDASRLREFDVDVHVYGGDASLRCFHVDLDKLGWKDLKSLRARLIASSGSELVGYHGIGSEKKPLEPAGRESKWDAELDLSALLKNETSFFYPFTTTLVELRLNREPLPLSGRNEICWF